VQYNTTDAERLFGWTADEAIGMLMSDTIVPEKYRSAHITGLANFIATGTLCIATVAM
jgi:hypothetical protein